VAAVNAEQKIVEQIEAAFGDTELPAAEALINRHCCECLETSEAYGCTPRSEASLTNLIARDWRGLASFYQSVFGCTLLPPERDYSGPALEAGMEAFIWLVPEGRIEKTLIR
jgi:hypothetical protein